MPLILTGAAGSSTLDSSAGLTFSDSSNQSAAASPFGLKNRIINGAMVIDQRNAGASVTPTVSTYTLDRWRATVGASSKFSVQQVSDAPTGFTNSLKITSLATTSLGATDYYEMVQRIEGYNVADLGWGASGASTVTLSFWVKSSLTGTFGGALNNADYSRSYPFTYTISAANTWEYKTITIAGDTTGTWQKTTSIGINLVFGLGVGSTYSGTAGTWASADYESATGATSVVGTNGATWYVTGVQLEIGTSATPFERRLYGQELANCQRYYEKSYPIDIVPGASGATTGALEFATGNVGVNASAYTGTFIRFSVAKRTNPTMTAYETISGTINLVNGLTTGAARSGTYTPYFAPGTNQTSIECPTGNSVAGFYCHWTASAEL